MPIMRKAGASLLASWILAFFASGITLGCWSSASAEPFFAIFGRQAPPVIVIPFEYVRGHIFLQLNLDGAGPSIIMLDTGFLSNKKTILVDSPVAARLRLRKGEKQDMTGMGTDDIFARKIEDVDVHMSESVVVHSSAEVISLSTLSGALAHPLDGIIGFAFLRDYVAEIDYAHRVLRLYAPAHYRYHGDGLRIPMEKLRPVIQAKVELPDGKEHWMQLLIDTGSDSELLFYRHFTDRYARSLASPSLQQSTYVGLGGKYICDVVRLRNIQFGNNPVGYNLMFNAPYVDLPEITAGASGKSRLDGHLGNPILQHANAIFDPSRHQFILEPVLKPPVKVAAN